LILIGTVLGNVSVERLQHYAKIFSFLKLIASFKAST